MLEKEKRSAELKEIVRDGPKDHNLALRSGDTKERHLACRWGRWKELDLGCRKARKTGNLTAVDSASTTAPTRENQRELNWARPM